MIISKWEENRARMQLCCVCLHVVLVRRIDVLSPVFVVAIVAVVVFLFFFFLTFSTLIFRRFVQGYLFYPMAKVSVGVLLCASMRNHTEFVAPDHGSQLFHPHKQIDPTISAQKKAVVERGCGGREGGERRNNYD